MVLYPINSSHIQMSVWFDSNDVCILNLFISCSPRVHFTRLTVQTMLQLLFMWANLRSTNICDVSGHTIWRSIWGLKWKSVRHKLSRAAGIQITRKWYNFMLPHLDDRCEGEGRRFFDKFSMHSSSTVMSWVWLTWNGAACIVCVDKFENNNKQKIETSAHEYKILSHKNWHSICMKTWARIVQFCLSKIE